MQKTKYRVKGKGLHLLLSARRGEAPRRVFMPHGEEFGAFHTEIPASFLDLVEVLGPALPEDDTPQEEMQEVIDDSEDAPPIRPPLSRQKKGGEGESFVRKIPARKK